MVSKGLTTAIFTQALASWEMVASSSFSCSRLSSFLNEIKSLKYIHQNVSWKTAHMAKSIRSIFRRH